MRQRTTRSGQALIEFVLVAPLLFLLILGILVFGLYLNAVTTVQQAVRVGTRAAAVGDTLGCPGDSAIQEANHQQSPTVYGEVDDQINGDSPWLQAGHQPLIRYAAVYGNAGDSQAENVMITVVYPYHPLVSWPGLLPSTVWIAQTYQMMVQTAQPPEATQTTLPSDQSPQYTHPAPPSQPLGYLVQPGGCSVPSSSP